MVTPCLPAYCTSKNSFSSVIFFFCFNVTYATKAICIMVISVEVIDIGTGNSHVL